MARSAAIEEKQGLPSASMFFKCLFFFVWVVSLVSAIAVIYSTYESRQYTQALEKLRREEIGLKVSAGQYQLEKSSLASYPRVESIAIDELKMSTPRSSDTVLVVRE